jgi:hypothetical protein
LVWSAGQNETITATTTTTTAPQPTAIPAITTTANLPAVTTADSTVESDTPSSIEEATSSSGTKRSRLDDDGDDIYDDDVLLRWLTEFDRHPESVQPPMKRYKRDELPWDMMVAYPHPTKEDVTVVAAADMPHAVKKQVNAVENSGKPNSQRDLHLDGLPIQLRMGRDVWMLTPDYNHEGGIRLYRKLNADVFDKTAKTRMRFGLASRALGGTMKKCIIAYKSKNSKLASPSTYDSYIELCTQTDKFVDVMNGNRQKGCSNITSPNHEHVFDLLDYVKFLTRWKRQADALNNPNLYFAPSTHQDSCWTALSIVILARGQLPKGYDIVQCRCGTDYLEKTFCISRGKNANATAQGTNGQIAGIGSNALNNMAASAKGNCGKSGDDTIYFTNELDATKVPKRKF